MPRRPRDLVEQVGVPRREEGVRSAERTIDDVIRTGGGASPSFRSNVRPARFGAGGQRAEPWECVCGEVNPAYMTRGCRACGAQRA
jgi:hypothetical protein